MDPLDYIVYESKRQSATVRELGGMCEAYEHLKGYLKIPSSFGLNEPTIKHLSQMITGNGEYRKVPAVFNQGMPAVNADNIPRLMENLVEIIANGPWVGWFVDDVIKEFLMIHPFADGNGRVASLMWNLMNGQYNHPQPLPYFFGEDSR